VPGTFKNGPNKIPPVRNESVPKNYWRNSFPLKFLRKNSSPYPGAAQSFFPKGSDPFPKGSDPFKTAGGGKDSGKTDFLLSLRYESGAKQLRVY
jgi:hypothetical protein